MITVLIPKIGFSFKKLNFSKRGLVQSEKQISRECVGVPMLNWDRAMHTNHCK